MFPITSPIKMGVFPMFPVLDNDFLIENKKIKIFVLARIGYFQKKGEHREQPHKH